MLHRHARQRGERAVPIVARLVRVNGRGLQQFAGGVDHGDFTSGANAGIDAEHRFGPCRRGEQQLVQIAAEDFDRFGFGGVAQLRQQFGADMRVRSDTPRPMADIGQPLVGAAAAIFDTEMGGDHRHAGVRHGGFLFLVKT